MDPYLEGASWPDFHNRLAVAISNRLAETIDEKYVIRIEPTVVEVDENSDGIRLMYPDVALFGNVEEPRSLERETSIATIAPRVTIPLLEPLRVRIPSVAVRSAEDGSLITSIEVLSPANKAGEARDQFRRKWLSLHAAGVHLLEIDLIRRGRRVFPLPDSQAAPYLITLTRASSKRTEAWPFTLREPIPSFPVPLMEPDPDAPIDLQGIFDVIYTQGRYGRAIDYSATPPPPPLSPEDEAWAREIIAAAVTQ